jgi:hypothetical protein
MTKYTIPFLLIFASCKQIPKKGEIWRCGDPINQVVNVDSIDRFDCVRFHWEDSTGKHIGVCSIEYFKGALVGLRDTSSGFVNPMTSVGTLDSGVIVIDSPGVNDTNMTPARIIDSSKRKGAPIYFRSVIDHSYPIEICLTDPEKNVVFVMTDEHYKILNLVNLYTKKQLDSAYRKGVQKSRREFLYLDREPPSPGPYSAIGWTELMELTDTPHLHLSDTTLIRILNEMPDSSDSGLIEKPYCSG